MIKPSNYKDHYRQFRSNVDFAVRTWHRQIQLDQEAIKNVKLNEALNRAAHYWNDQRHSARLITVIKLGNIFDNDQRSYSIDKTILVASSESDHFKKEALRKRKIVSGGEFDGIDDYIKNASELNENDLKIIEAEVSKAKIIWKRIAPLRRKIYAHNDIMSVEKRSKLHEAVNISDINNILQILLNVSNALWQAEINGQKPNFSTDHTQPIGWAVKDIEELIGSLLHAH